MRIGEVSALVDVPVPTLRSWEQRYAIPYAWRRDGGTRRYTATEVQMLLLMRNDVSRGIRAADAAVSVRALFDPSQPRVTFVNGVVSASVRRDTDAVCDWLDRAAHDLGLARCLDEVLFPALRRIGLHWQEGAATSEPGVDPVRLTADGICSWLRARAGGVTLAAEAPVILLARAPSDEHSIGLHALAVLLQHRQLRCRAFPGGMSTTAPSMRLQQANPAAVVLLSHTPATRTRAVAWLRKLEECGSTVFYAGNAFASPRRRRGVPGQYLGLNLQAAAHLIDTAVGKT